MQVNIPPFQHLQNLDLTCDQSCESRLDAVCIQTLSPMFSEMDACTFFAFLCIQRLRFLWDYCYNAVNSTGVSGDPTHARIVLGLDVDVGSCGIVKGLLVGSPANRFTVKKKLPCSLKYWTNSFPRPVYTNSCAATSARKVWRGERKLQEARPEGWFTYGGEAMDEVSRFQRAW